MKEKTVEELEKDVEEHENKLRDIELEIEAEDAVIPRGFAKTYTPTKEEYDRHCLLISRTAVGARYAFRSRKRTLHTKRQSQIVEYLF